MTRLAHHPRSFACSIALTCLAQTACADRASLDEDDTATEEGAETETGTESESGETETGGTETGGTETGETGETETGETGELPTRFCADACASTSPDGCLTPDACLEVCEAESPSWTEPVGEAFATCVAENPLCFETLDGCMLGQLNPEGTPVAVQVEGEGFDAHDGAVIRIWHDPDVEPAFSGEAVIDAGAFAFEWQEPVAVWDTNGPLLLLYIDVDDDGIRTADIDLTAALTTEWNGDLLAPAFESFLTSPLQPAAFVCDFLP